MKARCWLVFGPLLFCLLDGGLTLFGQSHAYWEGYSTGSYSGCFVVVDPPRNPGLGDRDRALFVIANYSGLDVDEIGANEADLKHIPPSSAWSDFADFCYY